VSESSPAVAAASLRITGTDFVIARHGRIAAIYLLFD
jgi:hypothetical protein